jgi:uncharacterized protein (TIGR02246 family)
MPRTLPTALLLLALGASLVAQTRESVLDPQKQAPPRKPSPTYPAPVAQTVDPALEQLPKQYEAAFNKQDAKALAMLYTDNAIRLGPNNQMLTGRAAIEGFYVSSLAGTSKPETLTTRVGRIEMLTPDVAVMEGRYEAAGTTVTTGIYVLTVVRQGGQWKLASVVPVPDAK